MKVRFTYLDALRGIAAFSVMLMHGNQIFELGIRTHAYLAVDFFFCLSGFILANAYDEKLAAGTVTRKKFLLKRLVRLYPMIVIGVLLGIAACYYASLPYLVPQNQIPILAAGALLLLPVGLLIGQEAFALNNALWSLCFELCANFVYAFSNRDKRRPRWHAAVWVLLAAALCLVINREGTIRLVGFESWMSFLEGFVRVGFSFCTGVLIFRSRIHMEMRRVPAAVPVALLLSVLFFPVIDDPRFFDFVSIVLIIPCVVLLAAATSEPRRGRSIFLYAGQLSYPIYIVHQPLLRLAAELRDRLLQPVSVWITAGLTMLAIWGIAHIFHIYFDTPVRAYLRQKQKVAPAIGSAAVPGRI